MSHVLRSIQHRVRQKVRAVGEALTVSMTHRAVDKAKVDPRVTYPCYRSFDQFIDVERLKSLDEYITQGVERHIRTQHDELFHAGSLLLDRTAAKRPGSRIIYLSRSKRPASYFDLDKAHLWERTEEAREFALLMELIDSFPFQAQARVMIMYDDSGKPVTAHRDHGSIDVCHEFIWFRTNLNKPFYVLNQKTGKRLDVESYSAWFDTCNQFHGADGQKGLSISMRVDGVFTDAFRKRIPKPSVNPASTAALWACSAPQ